MSKGCYNGRGCKGWGPGVRLVSRRWRGVSKKGGSRGSGPMGLADRDKGKEGQGRQRGQAGKGPRGSRRCDA